MIVESVLELCGSTPLVPLRHLVPENCPEILLKLEGFNPGHSVKDRPVMRMADLAQALDRLLEDVFGRPLSPGEVRRLLEAPAGITMGGERRTVTVLTSALPGFTSHSDGLAPDERAENSRTAGGSLKWLWGRAALAGSWPPR